MGLVFDWDKAAGLISEQKPSFAEAGLIEDWFWTGGQIYSDGKPVNQDDTYVYLASDWATPVLIMDHDIDNPIHCYVDEDKTSWSANTYWPESALAILDGGVQ